MPIFVYRCECGNTFERLVARDVAPPGCPACGGSTRKIPARPSIGRAGGAGPAAGDVGLPWQGPVAKGREYPGNPGSTAASD